jgi:hypothetical protein
MPTSPSITPILTTLWSWMPLLQYRMEGVLSKEPHTATRRCWRGSCCQIYCCLLRLERSSFASRIWWLAGEAELSTSLRSAALLILHVQPAQAIRNLILMLSYYMLSIHSMLSHCMLDGMGNLTATFGDRDITIGCALNLKSLLLRWHCLSFEANGPCAYLSSCPISEVLLALTHCSDTL